jgi:hypothetical protein
LIEELKFAAIFIMCDVPNVELGLQLFSDIIGSKDGHIGGERRELGDP